MRAMKTEDAIRQIEEEQLYRDLQLIDDLTTIAYDAISPILEREFELIECIKKRTRHTLHQVFSQMISMYSYEQSQAE